MQRSPFQDMRFRAVIRSLIVLVTGWHASIVAQPPHLRLTFPHRIDTTVTSRIRLAGATDPGASLWINRQKVKVYPHGAFVGRVELSAGRNAISVLARLGQNSTSDSLVVYRLQEPKQEAFPFTPWPAARPAQTVKETTLWNVAVEGAAIAVIPDSIPLSIVGRQAGRYKVRLSTSQAAYIDEQDIAWTDQPEQSTAAAVSAPLIYIGKEWIRLSMRVDHPVPFMWYQSLEPAFLELTLYNAYAASQWITLPEVSSELKGITWSQPEENVMRWRIDLSQRQQWGHRVRFRDGFLNVEIRRTPVGSSKPDAPLQGLLIAVDAGHGGSESGAISPIGLEEKQINLLWAGFLADALRQAGAAVVLTRSTDTTLTIGERLQRARQANAQMYICLHNNSVGPAVDAALVRGASTYFSVPHNQALAADVYRQLVSTGLRPYGCIQNGYITTRMREMPVVLVEGVFLSSPDDEQLIMRTSFLRRMAKAVCAGVVDFVRSRR
jgi:N-acetylmuramoyl-L-alanine amidase